MQLLECMFSFEHCICAYVESNPFMVIPLLDDSSPCRGILFYRYKEHSRRRLILEVVLKESRVVVLVVACIHVLELYKF